MLQREEAALLEVVRHPDAAIFVGAWLSVMAGLPTWRALLLQLVECAEQKGYRVQLAKDAVASGDLLDAADKLADTVPAMEMADAMRGRLGFSAAQPHEVHRLLTRLGPERFITTNFDSLIEQQLGFEGRLGHFHVVTNQRVAELADIQKASANRFIFKPHGDLNDAASLVLSTTHYNKILLGGSNLVRGVLETLFVSRPIVFVGYSLKDPDTMLVLRSLRERFLAGTGEFWAIVPDAGPDLAEFWRRQHGVRLVGYNTTNAPSGRDHGELLNLLRRLGTSPPQVPKPRTVIKKPKTGLGLAGLLRYAARLIRPEPAKDFGVQVHLTDRSYRTRFPPEIAKFHGSSLSDLLDTCLHSYILVGAAGSGKSFGFRQFLSRKGRALLESLDGGEDSHKRITVPVLLDARLYQGSFEQLASSVVPTSVDLANLPSKYELVLLVDSIDEMPVEFLDTGEWREDLRSFASQVESDRTVFGTRRTDIIGSHDLACFSVEPLARGLVEDALLDMGRSATNLSIDLVDSLRSPFALTLGRRFLGRRQDIRNTSDLIQTYLEQTLGAVLH